MARLPIPGQDNGTWGDILNEYLLVSHNDDGTLQKDGLIDGAQQKSQKGTAGGYAALNIDGVIPPAQLGSGTADSTTFLRGDNTWATIAGASDATTSSKGIIQLAGDLAGTADSPTVPGLADKADDNTVVKLTGVQSIDGIKTFTSAPVVPDGSFSQAKVTNLTSDLAAKVDKSTYTTKGDILVATGAAAAVRLGAGGDNQILTADSAAPTGVKWASPASGGDASTNTATSVDSEVALFSGTSGKTLKRATGTGLATLASGVLSTVSAPSGNVVGTTDSQSLTNKTLDTTTTITVKDANLTIVDDNDTTSGFKFQASGISTGTTRTITLPNANTTMLGTNSLDTDTTLAANSDSLIATQRAVKIYVDTGNADKADKAFAVAMSVAL